MKKLALAVLVALLACAPAQASWWRKSWRWHQRRPAIAHAIAPSVCPLDGPDKLYTIVNAGVTGVTLQQLAAVMRATRDESFALRMYYWTPCATFGSGGKPIYLSNGPAQYDPASGDTHYSLGGVHHPNAIYVETGLTPDTTWVRAFSHEIMEDLVDPNGTLTFGTYLAEVCDPVENLTYEVDQLRVSDFVTPAFFNGAHTGPWDAGHYLSGPA